MRRGRSFVMSKIIKLFRSIRKIPGPGFKLFLTAGIKLVAPVLRYYV